MAIPYIPRVARGEPVTADGFNKVLESLGYLSPAVNGGLEATTSGMRVIPSRSVPGGSGGGVDGLTIGPFFSFGYSITGDNVTIYSGEIHWGTRVIEVAQATNTISVDKSYVWAELDYATAIGTIPAASATRPTSSDTVYRCWLFQFSLSGSAASIYRIGHIGNIELPGNYA